MTEIIPAILPKDYNELREKTARVRGLAKIVQIDVCDGHFVPSTTWPFAHNDDGHFEKIVREEEGLPEWETIDFEIDLMVAKPALELERWILAGAKRVIVHVESTDDLATLVHDFHKRYQGFVEEDMNIELGLALGVETPIELIKDIVQYATQIQCMGIARIGFQGEPFDERVLEKISTLRKLYPERIISVDGGVNLETAPKLIEAGATTLVVGSALFSSADVEGTLNEFKKL